MVSLVMGIGVACAGVEAPGPPGATTEPRSTSLPPVGATPPPTHGPTFPADDPRSVPEDVFTAPADPLTLMATTDAERSATEVIGSEGGTISATGEDGTTYTLTVPEGSLPLAIPITMSPLTSLTGFPAEATPTHSLGINLAPEGLELANPATLEIQPSTPIPDNGAFGLSYRETGSEAGFHLFERPSTGITMQVDHFSGHAVSFPIFIASERPLYIKQFFTQAEVEARLRSEVAWWLTLERQRQLTGAESHWDTIDVARYVLPIFKRLVISPRVAVADRGCAEAYAALLAYLEYQRQRQNLGVADNPEFDLVGAGMFAPAALVELAIAVCFRDAYERCAETGEFPALGVFYLTMLTRNERAFDVPPTPGAIALATEYLRRCGRWRLKANTTNIDDDHVLRQLHHAEDTREFFLQWEPGPEPYRIPGSTVTGSGPVESTLVERTGPCTYVFSNMASLLDAAAEIKSMSFDHYAGPTLTGDPIPPVPTKLDLTVGFGLQSGELNCVGSPLANTKGTEWFQYVYDLARMQFPEHTVIDYELFAEGGARINFDSGWLFSMPYKASQVVDGTLVDRYGNERYVRIELIVEHDPL